MNDASNLRRSGKRKKRRFALLKKRQKIGLYGSVNTKHKRHRKYEGYKRTPKKLKLSFTKQARLTIAAALAAVFICVALFVFILPAIDQSSRAGTISAFNSTFEQSFNQPPIESYRYIIPDELSESVINLERVKYIFQNLSKNGISDSGVPKTPAAQLCIPKLDVKVPVFVAMTEKQFYRNIKYGVSYYPYTANTFSIGNISICGHSEGTSGFFARLDELVQGDQIFLHEYEASYIYEVERVETADKDSWKIVDNTDYPALTLTTYLDDGQRLAVRCKLIKYCLIEEIDESPEPAETSEPAETEEPVETEEPYETREPAETGEPAQTLPASE